MAVNRKKENTSMGMDEHAVAPKEPRKLSKEETSTAMSVLKNWFPDDDPKLSANWQIVYDHFIAGSAGSKDTSGSELVPFAFKVVSFAMEKVDKTSPLARAMVEVLVDVFFLVLHLCGIHMTGLTKFVGALLVEVDMKVLMEMVDDVKVIAKMKGNKAGMPDAVLCILKKMYDAGVFRVILKVIREMDYFEWIKLSLIVIANVLLWTASGGAAFAASVGITILSAVELVKDCVEVVRLVAAEPKAKPR